MPTVTGSVRWVATLSVIAAAASVSSAILALGESPAGASAPSATAYVANNSDNSVTPIDTATNTAGTAITGGSMEEPNGIAITPDGKTAYAVN